MRKILLIFTGGTICSTTGCTDGKNQSHAIKTSSLLEENFKKSDSPFANDVEFEYVFFKQDILSENVTIYTWNALLDKFRDESVQSNFSGIIVLHGTDTLAYTSSLLSLVLSGYKIPVCLVSAQLNLKDKRTNGYANFRASVELIINGIAPNVYVVYRNVKDKDHKPGEFLVHYGNHLVQCPNHSNNFHSFDEMTIPGEKTAKLTGKPFETDSLYINNIDCLKNGVMMIHPYTNLSYDLINLDGVTAIVHGTYHSQSVCIGRAENPDETKDRSLKIEEVVAEDRPYSILSLIKRCKEKNIPVVLAPCNEENFSYSTTKNALDAGAFGMADTTLETAYTKVLLGCSLGKNGEELKAFLNKSINYDFPDW